MANADPLIVTLDGPAGVGKSTLAARLAGALGVAFLDTGAMFRAAAYTLGEGAWDWPQGILQQKLGDFEFSLAGSGTDTRLLLNGQPLPQAIRSEETGRWASQLAIVPSVRAYMKMAQIFLGQTTALVAEGRDMGTVVFPGARHKFFLDADPRGARPQALPPAGGPGQARRPQGHSREHPPARRPGSQPQHRAAQTRARRHRGRYHEPG
jgi:Cytidylate kinase